jgi:hypothetical protein
VTIATFPEVPFPTLTLVLALKIQDFSECAALHQRSHFGKMSAIDKASLIFLAIEQEKLATWRMR